MLTKYIALLLFLLSVSVNAATDSKVADLLAMKARSKNGLIPLDMKLFRSYVSKSRRSYTSVIFFTSERVAASRPQMLLNQALDELSVVSQSFSRSAEAREKVFFFVCYFENSEDIFRLFNMQSVPLLLQVEPSQKSLALPIADRSALEIRARYPWTAENVADWLHDLGAPVVTVQRPSVLANPRVAAGLIFAVAAYFYMVYQLFHSGLIYNPTAWSIIALVIYWFSVSGGMYNIIRGIPMFEVDERGLPRLIPRQIGKSYSGIEGYIVGATYLLFSGSLSVILYGVTKLRSGVLRTMGSVLFMLLSSYAIFNIFEFWRAKTGYRLVSYL